MKKCCVVLLVLYCGLIGCAKNFNQFVSPKLHPQVLNSKLKSEELDLSQNGNCPGTLPLNVVNMETRVERYLINTTHPTGDWYITPKVFTGHVARYMEEKLVESKLKVDKVRGKKILVFMEGIKIKNSKGGWGVHAYAQFRIQIPEIDHARVYSGDADSPMGDYAVAYAVGIAVMQFLNDPVFQKYVRCQGER